MDGVRIYNNAHYGIHNYDEPLAANRNVFRNNIVYNNGVLSNSGCGILYTGGQDGVVHNNIVYGNPGGGICVGHGGTAANIIVYNNTIVGNAGNDGFAALLLQTGSGHVVRNNISWNNGFSNYLDHTAATFDHNLIGINPLFVNAATADFHLQASSPAIDAGVPWTSATVAGSSSTTLTVQDGRAFLAGDSIRIATQATVTVAAVSGSTLTLSSARTWASGASVSPAYNGNAPDQGALESGATAYPPIPPPQNFRTSP